MRTFARAMLAVSAFLAVAAGVYGIASGEEAGTVMLLLAAALALTIGVFLTGAPEDPAVGEQAAPAGAEASMYLPHSSVWPFWIGVGALVLGNGLALGLWGLVPGGVVTAIGVIGFARQSRHRD